MPKTNKTNLYSPRTHTESKSLSFKVHCFGFLISIYTYLKNSNHNPLSQNIKKKKTPDTQYHNSVVIINSEYP